MTLSNEITVLSMEIVLSYSREMHAFNGISPGSTLLVKGLLIN